MQRRRILLDMDGVLINFAEGACRAHEITTEQMYEHCNGWSIYKAVGKALGIRNYTLEDFNNVINTIGGDFWVTLHPLPWHRELIQLVENYSTEWFIATDPGDYNGASGGKLRWLRNYFGNGFDRFIITPHKYIGANKETCLIDDRQTKVELFRSEGGNAVLFPAYGNVLKLNCNNPLPLVEEALKLLWNQCVPN